MIEGAWKEGLDPQGASHFNHRLQGTRAWIGATEIFTLLTSLGIRWALYFILLLRLGFMWHEESNYETHWHDSSHQGFHHFLTYFLSSCHLTCKNQSWIMHHIWPLNEGCSQHLFSEMICICSCMPSVSPAVLAFFFLLVFELAHCYIYCCVSSSSGGSMEQCKTSGSLKWPPLQGTTLEYCTNAPLVFKASLVASQFLLFNQLI